MNKGVYPVFPDWIFSGTIELTPEIERGIRADIDKIIEDSSHHTNFGWLTLKEVPLSGNARKLQLLIGSYFVECVKTKFKHILDRNIQVVEPTLLGIKPEAIYPVTVERNRWYRGIVWLQTTDKGSSLYMENFASKLYSDPPGVQEYTHYIKPGDWKYVFFPAHLPAGFAPNTSMIDTIVFDCTFTAFPNAKN